MSATLLTILNYNVTAWHLVGLLGTALFSTRWIVQLVASTRAKKSVIPIHFWYLSAGGSCLLILYFGFGQHDAVGVISNVLPLCLAIYNFFIIYNYHEI